MGSMCVSVWCVCVGGAVGLVCWNNEDLCTIENWGHHLCTHIYAAYTILYNPWCADLIALPQSGHPRIIGHSFFIYSVVIGSWLTKLSVSKLFAELQPEALIQSHKTTNNKTEDDQFPPVEASLRRIRSQCSNRFLLLLVPCGTAICTDICSAEISAQCDSSSTDEFEFNEKRQFWLTFTFQAAVNYSNGKSLLTWSLSWQRRVYSCNGSFAEFTICETHFVTCKTTDIYVVTAVQLNEPDSTSIWLRQKHSWMSNAKVRQHFPKLVKYFVH